jgi:CRP/FNR family transcriptional regulator
MLEELKLNYGHLFEEALLQEINSVGVYKEVPQDFTLIQVGQYINWMPLLISGAIKIFREDGQGDELLLYFLERGDTCTMTLSCCLGQKKSEIKAVAETDAKLIMIPIQKMEEWTSKYKSWRNFVFDSYHNRFMEILDTIDNIAFFNMDKRLLKYLKDKAKVTKDNTIHTTHQEIAHELHTSRVVISRLLKTLESENIVELHRNRIRIK